MAQPTISSERFAELVQWAYDTLPEKIRNLPDFPGIQVADEPPEEMFQKMSMSLREDHKTPSRGKRKQTNSLAA